MKLIARLLVLTLVLLGASVETLGQQINKINQFVTPGTSTASNILSHQVTFSRLTWHLDGTISTCSFKMEKSDDNITWTDLTASQDCTVIGKLEFITPFLGKFIRYNVTTLTGGGTLHLVWAGLKGPGCGHDYSGIFAVETAVNPTAGTELSVTVPDDQRWRFLSLSFQLITDATPGDRVPFFNLTDGMGGVYLRTFADRAIGASQIGFVTAASFGTAGGISPGPPTLSTTAIISLPVDLVLLPGHVVTTSTQGLQPGDDYTNPQFLVERCPN